MKKRWRAVVLAVAMFGGSVVCALADALTIAVMPVSASQREAITEITSRYNSRGTHQILVVAYPHEQFKARIDELLADPDSGLDVIVWFGGERLRRLIRKGRLQPLDDLADLLNEAHYTTSALSTVRYKGRLWGMPVSYYPWGIFYRKSVFARLNLGPPKTGEALEYAMVRLRDAGMTPFALGSEAPWTLLAWFDYLDLRLNGLAFHQQLTAGDIPFTDARVKRVFETWARWLRAGLYPAAHAQLDWRGALPYFYRARAPMMLMGQFALAEMPQSVREDTGFIPFPTLDPIIQPAEDAPTDILVIPKYAPNPEAARDFLRFMAEPAQQAYLNQQYGTFSPLKAVPPPEDPVLAQGHAILSHARGLAQFFDRDAPEVLVQGMLQMVQEFVAAPDRLEALLSTLEQIRQRLPEPGPAAAP